MEKYVEFNLDEQLESWVCQIELKPSVKKSNTGELKSHLQEMYSDLIQSGLEEPEAFFIASRRLSEKYGFRNDSTEKKEEKLRIGRSLNILGGILAYYLLYFFTKSTARGLLCIFLYFDINGEAATGWYNRYFFTIQFILFLFFVRIYFLENKTISFIEKIKIRSKHALLMLLSTIFFAILDVSLLPVVKWYIRHDRYSLTRYWNAEIIFLYSFPLLICIAFVAIYAIYYKRVGK